MAVTSVSCCICGHSAATLARHLKASHSITADAYRVKFPGARIRSEACEANRRAAISKAHVDSPRVGQKKTVTCPCGASHEVGLTFASKDLRCTSCKARDEEALWASKIEGAEFVTCSCGYRAENLTSHIQNAHPEWVGCYPGQVVATGSAVRDKTVLKGRILSEETKKKMSANAGRWNSGLTKETDLRVAVAAERRTGQPSWSKGLTKAGHPSLQSTSEKLSSLWSGSARYWSNGLKADLASVDFTPFLDEVGAVDRKTMSDELGISELTITKYMESLGLRLSTKYVDARAERATIRFTCEELQQYALANGKVVIAQAMVGLGRDYKVVKRECARHGLETFNHRIRQTICLDAVSKALGGVVFEQEWRSRKFMTERGNFYRFDGHFPSHNLVVEFHGYQHWVFPSVYIKDAQRYFELQERDRIKENLIHEDPVLRYFLVREDEPYADPEYIRGRLMDEGFLDPGK